MPLGTLFEDTAQLFLDGVIAELMTILGKRKKILEKTRNLLLTNN